MNIDKKYIMQSSQLETNNQENIEVREATPTSSWFPTRQELSKSIITKVVIIVLFGGISTFLFDYFIYNPPQDLQVAIEVVDEKGNPIPKAMIYFGDRKETGLADKDGWFRGTISVRKRQEKLWITCTKNEYETDPLPCDIPKNKQFELTVRFNLKLSGFFQPLPKEDDLF